MIPFKLETTRTLAPATGWAGANPWASFHNDNPAAEAAPSETNQPSARNDNQAGCRAGSWGY